MERVQRVPVIRPLDIHIKYLDGPEEIPEEFPSPPRLYEGGHTHSARFALIDRGQDRRSTRSRIRLDNSHHEYPSESPEKGSPRRYMPTPSQKRKTLPPSNISTLSLVEQPPRGLHDKNTIKRELLAEWSKERDTVERYLNDRRCKLKISNKKQ